MNRIKGWWPEAALVAILALITLAAAVGWTAGLDLAVRDAMFEIRTPVLYWTARVLNYLGQGSILTWAIAFVLSAYLYWRSRDWKIFLPWATTFAMTYLITGPLKLWSMRDAPGSDLPNAVEFFNHAAEYTRSYPGGHVVNAIAWWGVIVLLALKIRPVPARLMRWAPPIIVFCTTIYLNFHWLTDNLAAIAIGLFIYRIVHRLYR
ncbi:MAG TPA: phosphatase PAP2 family protein [Candidatus Limnocylindrales bacterium]